MQKLDEELNEKIERIELDKDIIGKNKKKGKKGDKRNFYSYCCGCFSCCEKSLENIKKLQKENEIKLNELITSCKENTSEYFGGAAFITFNTIKEQEKYLSQFPNHFFGHILNFFKNLFYFFKNCYTKKYSIDYYKRFIKVEKAPEPDDVIFENIQTGKFRRIIYIILVFV